jgi:hypothetical protein
MPLAHWFTDWWAVVEWGAVGAFIDFYIGKAGQRRVRDWLETWWLRLSDVRWGNLGREEALFAVKVMDRLFGSRLFSAQRMIVVAAATLVGVAYIEVLTLLSDIELISWRTFLQPAYFVWLVVILLSFAASFSITRFAAIIVARCFRARAQVLSLFGLLCLLIFQYLLLCYWAPIVHRAMAAEFQVIYQGGVNSYLHEVWLLLKLMDFVVTHLAVILPSREIHNIGILLMENSSALLPVIDPHFAPASFLFHLSALLNLIPNFSRLAIMIIFVGFFLLKPLQGPIMTLWLRIIESDKPVFTLVLGGGAAIIKAIHGIAANL